MNNEKHLQNLRQSKKKSNNHEKRVRKKECQSTKASLTNFLFILKAGKVIQKFIFQVRAEVYMQKWRENLYNRGVRKMEKVISIQIDTSRKDTIKANSRKKRYRYFICCILAPNKKSLSSCFLIFYHILVREIWW